jgi:uncharacterized membrane protein (UPF0127 family)
MLLFLGWLLTGVFQTAELRLGDEIMKVEIAKEPEERVWGLRRRTKLGPDEGMLFVFDRPKILSFWMQEVKIPLSIGFFNKLQILMEVFDMFPSDEKEPPIYTSSLPALYALEVPLGWFQKHQIEPGMRFSLERKE